MPELTGIAITPKLMGEMQERENAEVTIEAGIIGDARGSKRNRQVSILFVDDWDDACAEIGRELPWTARRANLLVTGCRAPQRENAIVSIGEVELSVTMETDPCDLMEKTAAGLKRALEPDWRGGVCCVVRKGGLIRVGDEVRID